MKPSQLAKQLKVSDAEILRLGVQVGFKGISFKTQLAPEQINAIEQQFVLNSRCQLQPATEVHDSEPDIEIPDGEIEQVQDKDLAAPEKPELGIAEHRQTALSNAMGASEQQQAHILETELIQASDDGLRVGAIKEFVRATKELEGAMLVRNAVFQKGQAKRNRLNAILEDGSRDDFLTNSQLSQQTFMQTAEVGAATDLDVHQALKNLGINI